LRYLQHQALRTDGIDVNFPFTFLLVACLSFLSPAQGAERSGDAAFVDAYQEHARAAIALETESLLQIEIASDEERFNLYREYDRFLGTWLQVERLQAQLAVAVEADSSVEEEEARTDLRDEAQFVLLELAQTEGDLERNAPALKRPDHVRINQAIWRLLVEVRTAIGRLLSEQCAHLSCAPVS
jgi:hypothetical protein